MNAIQFITIDQQLACLIICDLWYDPLNQCGIALNSSSHVDR